MGVYFSLGSPRLLGPPQPAQRPDDSLVPLRGARPAQLCLEVGVLGCVLTWN